MSGILNNLLVKLGIRDPDLTEFIIELKMDNKSIKRVQRRNEKNASNLKHKAKKALKEGNQARVDQYMNQYMKARSTSHSLDMFTIAMDGLIADLQNAQSLQNIGTTMGKITGNLEKLGALDVADTSKMTAKLNRQMTKLGISTEVMLDGIDSYSTFEVESYTDEDVENEINKLVDEVKAETGLPQSTVDLLEKRKELDKEK